MWGETLQEENLNFRQSPTFEDCFPGSEKCYQELEHNGSTLRVCAPGDIGLYIRGNVFMRSLTSHACHTHAPERLFVMPERICLVPWFRLLEGD